MGAADEPGVPVQEEADQCCQTDKAMGSWRPTGDLVMIGLVWSEKNGWVSVLQTRGKKKEWLKEERRCHG